MPSQARRSPRLRAQRDARVLAVASLNIAVHPLFVRAKYLAEFAVGGWFVNIGIIFAALRVMAGAPLLLCAAVSIPGGLMLSVATTIVFFAAAHVIARVICCGACGDWNELKYERMEHAVGELASAHDVIVFQEMMSSWMGDTHPRALVAIGQKHGFRFFCRSPPHPTLPSLGCSSGLVLLSKHPILKSSAQSFRTVSWFDAFVVNRGLLHARIALSAEGARSALLVDVFTTHLMPSGGQLNAIVPGAAYLAGLISSQQRAQMDEVAERVRIAGATSDAVVALGDFNIGLKAADTFASGEDQRNERYVHLARVMGSLAPPLHDVLGPRPGAVAAAHRWAHTFGHVGARSGEPAEHIITARAMLGKRVVEDFIFSTVPALSAEVLALPARAGDAFQFASDHHALTARLDISGLCGGPTLLAGERQ